MPQPAVNQSVNPSSINTKLPGKPQRAGDLNLDLRDLMDRVERIERVVSGGILFTSPDGKTTSRLTIDNSGNPVWTRQ